MSKKEKDSQFSESEANTIISNLYRGFFFREPDEIGLRHWISKLLTTQNANLILREFLNSQEHIQAKLQLAHNLNSLLPSFQKSINRPINILDVGSILIDEEKPIWGSLSQYADLNVVGFDPNTSNFETVMQEGHKTKIANFGFALGDGKNHILHINNEINTSSFYPILPNESILHLKDIRTIKTKLVETKKLDDLQIQDYIDFLKLDVQGFELVILESSIKTLTSTGMIFIEVAFSEIYRGQALFFEIDSFMTQNGFQLIDLYNHKYPMTEVRNKSKDLLLWGDALYRKIPADLESRSIQNLILGTLFGKWNLAEWGNTQKISFH